MKVLTPTPLMRDAAAVLEPVREDVVVIGAVAVQVALAAQDVALTPTRDVDAGVANEAVERVVAHLERQGCAAPRRLMNDPSRGSRAS